MPSEKTTEASNKLLHRRKSVYKEILLFLLEVEQIIKPDNFEFRKRKIVTIIGAIFTFLLLTISIVTMSLLQNNTIYLFENNHTELIDNYRFFCSSFHFSNFSIVSHPLALLLSLMYTCLFWRKSCCLSCLFGRPASPSIINPFKKRDRFMSGIVYCIIAYEVMNIVEDAVTRAKTVEGTYVKFFPDPTGLLRLLARITEMCVAALRYYPPMVAFTANSSVTYITAAFYMLIDLANNIYIEGDFNKGNKHFPEKINL
jgi:hypothetical protein